MWPVNTWKSFGKRGSSFLSWGKHKKPPARYLAEWLFSSMRAHALRNFGEHSCCDIFKEDCPSGSPFVCAISL
jgi:hypothetical protein